MPRKNKNEMDLIANLDLTKDKLVISSELTESLPPQMLSGIPPMVVIPNDNRFKYVTDFSSITEEKRGNFIRNEDGTINWRKMVKPEYLFINNQYKDEIEKKYDKPIGELELDKLEDKYLLISLAGLNDLATLRKYKSITYPHVVATRDFVSVICEIEWEAFENERPKTVSDGADSHPDNCSGIFNQYLTTIAINRAFGRCVRKSLGINILCREELNPGSRLVESKNGSSDPKTVLIKLVESKGKGFEELSAWWLKRHPEIKEEIQKWKGYEDIPNETAWGMLAFMKEEKGK